MPSQALRDDRLGFAHDAVDQLAAGRHVVDEAGDHAARPRARLHVALLHDLHVGAGNIFADVVDRRRRALLLLDLDDLVDRRVAQDAFGIAQRPHDQTRVEFAGLHQRPLHVFVHRRFLRGDETRAHVHAFGAECERRDETAPVGHPAGSDERNLQRLGRQRQQDEVRHVVFARMTSALEAVDAHGVTADLFGLERVPHRRALVNDLDAVLLQHRQVLLGTAARGLDDAHAAFDDGLDEFGVRRVGERRQERQVHPERLVGHFVAALDRRCELLGRAQRQGRDHAEAARVGNGRREFGQTDEMHAALDDRVLDAKELGDAGLHGRPRIPVGANVPLSPIRWRSAQPRR